MVAARGCKGHRCAQVHFHSPGTLRVPGRPSYVLTGKHATRDNILDGLARLRDNVAADKSANATAVIYYSGHGWCDAEQAPPDYYLIPCNVSEHQLRSRALRASDFAAGINELEARRLLVILDCCHAGGMGVKGVSPEGFASAAVPPRLFMGKEKMIAAAVGSKGLEDLATGSGRAVISSSQANQPSYMRRDGKMSIFTYHLIEALTGHAKSDEKATEVLVTDIMSHVHRQVPISAGADWNREQQPDYQLSGNFPVGLLIGGKGLPNRVRAPDPSGSNRLHSAKSSRPWTPDQYWRKCPGGYSLRRF